MTSLGPVQPKWEVQRQLICRPSSGDDIQCCDELRETHNTVTMLILVWVMMVSVASGQEASCHLPAGHAGLCVEITRCGHLTKLISNLQKPFPRDVSLLIRDSFLCGSQGSSVSVCCPRDGLVTPVTEDPDKKSPLAASRRSQPNCEMQAGAGAECVTYSQCSPFVQLLVNIKKPLDPVVPAMIR